MPTALAAAGVDYPKTFAGHEVIPVEGVSLLPAFNGERVERGKPLFWEHEGNRAVRDGKWKLVSRFPQDWELYDLDADPTETKNLAAENPDKVKELAALHEAWSERCNVRPWSLTKRNATK
jgi:arylsulfatase